MARAWDRERRRSERVLGESGMAKKKRRNKKKNNKRRVEKSLTLDQPRKLFSFFISMRSFWCSGSVSKKATHSRTTPCTTSSGKPVSVR